MYMYMYIRHDLVTLSKMVTNCNSHENDLAANMTSIQHSTNLHQWLQWSYYKWATQNLTYFLQHFHCRLTNIYRVFHSWHNKKFKNVLISVRFQDITSKYCKIIDELIFQLYRLQLQMYYYLYYNKTDPSSRFHKYIFICTK